MSLKIKNIVLGLGVTLLLALTFSSPAMAVVDPGTGVSGGSSSDTSTTGTASSDNQTVYKNSDPCHPERDKPPGKKLTTSQLASCEACNKKDSSAAKNCLKNNAVVKDINLIVNGLAGMVAVVCVAMIVLGGIKYSLARNNPQEIANARNHIINAVFAMICFMLIWALLQYLVPGGVFN